MSIIDAIEKMTNSISENVPTPEKEYIGEDGLLHCVTCGEKVEKIVELMGIKKTVRCICSCRKKELQVQRDRDRQDDIERSRMICFQETNMRNWNFANDDKKNAKISDVMKRYADNFKEFKKDGKGLLLYGPCGTGKTYYAACIANELIDIGYDILMTNFGKLINKIQGTFDKK